MKKLLSIFLIILMISPLNSYSQDDVDPEVMNAILDASKASSSTESNSKDPLEGVVIGAPSAKPDSNPAKDIAKKLKEQGNKVSTQPTEEPKKENKKVIPKGPEVISNDEMEMLTKSNSGSTNIEDKKVNTDPAKKRKAIYVPAPVENDDATAGYLLERDSSKIITKKMSANDSISMKVCFNAGLTIALDNDIQDEFQRIIIDDKIFFDAQEFDNRKGVYVRLKKPVPEGKHWESAIRLIRKSDDKQYLINLVGLSCPSFGLSPFPKALYIQDHYGVIQANNKVLTPEDTIIALSKGMPRIQKNRIRVYDMVASSGSKWVVFGVEVQYPDTEKDKTMPKMVVLDNLQVNQVSSKLEYLPVHSNKATNIRGVSTLRFKLSVNISKDYILKSRYLHLMFLDEEAGHYQYVRVDALPYFLSLVRRGFEL